MGIELELIRCNVSHTCLSCQEREVWQLLWCHSRLLAWHRFFGRFFIDSCELLSNNVAVVAIAHLLLGLLRFDKVDVLVLVLISWDWYSGLVLLFRALLRSIEKGVFLHRVKVDVGKLISQLLSIDRFELGRDWAGKILWGIEFDALLRHLLIDRFVMNDLFLHLLQLNGSSWIECRILWLRHNAYRPILHARHILLYRLTAISLDRMRRIGWDPWRDIRRDLLTSNYIVRLLYLL